MTTYMKLQTRLSRKRRPLLDVKEYGSHISMKYKRSQNLASTPDG